jgi:D-threo-aldose 1-dehydrogenase
VDKLPIPDSSVAISRLGFGCARIFGGRELRQAAALIEAAISCGVTHFDTAPSYDSESVLGAVIGDARDITIATKIGIPRYTRPSSTAKKAFGPLYRATMRPLLGHVPAVKARLLQLAMKPALTNASIVKRKIHKDEVLREVEESLRRLRRTTIDLYLLHEPEAIELTDELCDVFLSLRKDGVIKAFGLAFGALPNDSISFGTVVQCRFPRDSPTFASHDKIRIYHGVVRFRLQRPINEDETHMSAQELIVRALEGDPGSAVIFSASSKHHIHQMSEICRAVV